jgi:putative Holliday junction resolvase
VKILALDYGRARTGVAVSDPTGTLARPLAVVAKVVTDPGLADLCAIIEREQPELILVGLPLTLRGERGPQAAETDAFVARLRTRCRTPIQTEDERFTTTIARRTSSSGRRSKPDDPAAAAVLLQGYLDRTARTRSSSGDSLPDAGD